MNLSQKKIVLILLVCIFQANCFAPCPHQLSSREVDEKLKELQNLLIKVPQYPNSAKIDSNYIAKNRNVIVSNYYNSSASYEDVKNFYIKEFGREGWKLVHERNRKDATIDIPKSILFQKNEDSVLRENTNSIVIHYADTSRDMEGWDISISVMWSCEKPS